MDNTSILVLGAGELGMVVLRNLAQHPKRSSGAIITVLLKPSTIESKDPAKRRDIAELRFLGVEVIPGDLSASVTELSGIFKRFHTVICCTGFVTGRGLQIKLVKAILNAGVKRYFPWQFGVDYDVIGKGSAQDLFDEQLDVRNHLRSQNKTEWVIISTGMFTSFLFEPSFGVVDLANSTVHALGSWETAVTVTTPEDIGKLTAEIYYYQPRITNSVVYTGGDTITYGQLADIVDTITDKKINRVEWDVRKLRADLVQDPDDAIKKYRVVFAEGKGVSWDIEKTFNAQQKLATMDVIHWVKKHLN
ncbi:MAG: Putative oxidoreductase [uncultured Adhaeribacter sp.]|uniref:Oxidoreductase n=1 Tax=uncultured Adhaeribacter sp. TaxID=448109 RepID=A0A6J4JBS4_9BACT|nr:MAG: Putative oxidoreductase [uncultured Adhaeribacter sp.]